MINELILSGDIRVRNGLALSGEGQGSTRHILSAERAKRGPKGASPFWEAGTGHSLEVVIIAGRGYWLMGDGVVPIWLIKGAEPITFGRLC